jgi:hypothetical protein
VLAEPDGREQFTVPYGLPVDRSVSAITDFPRAAIT